MSTENKRECKQCGRELLGRADQKYCSDYCRNAYHHKNNKVVNNYMVRVNRILKRNRKILAELNPKGKSKVTRFQLFEKGFNFNYFTNTYTTQKGVTYFFCYDYGYLPLEDELYALVMKEKYVG